MGDLLTSFGVDWRLLLIQAVNFGVLLSALSYFLYRPVTNMLDERRRKIAQGVKDAEAAAQHLARAEEEATAVVASASQEAAMLVASAKVRGEEKAKEIVDTATARGARIEEDAQAKAVEAARRALEESNEEIARTAILAAERLLKKKLQ